jgi:hypothetical protein
VLRTAARQSSRLPWRRSPRAGGGNRPFTQVAAPLLWAIHIGCPKNCTYCSMVMAQKLRPRTHGQAAVHRFDTLMLRPKSPRRGDDRVSGTDANQHDDISHNGSSEFGGSADSAETLILGRVLINAQIAAPLRLSKKLHSLLSSIRRIIKTSHSCAQTRGETAWVAVTRRC